MFDIVLRNPGSGFDINLSGVIRGPFPLFFFAT